MQPAPRPPASVPLGGSLRASRAAQLARPNGPLAAVDLAGGRALTVERLAGRWIAIAVDGTPPPSEADVAGARAASVPVRRRRLGAALALAGALGAAVVALATGFSGSPPRAVAGPTATAVAALPPVAPPPRRDPARGGRASALPRPEARPPPAPPAPAVPVTVHRPAASAPPPPPPLPPPLPELPPAPAL